MIFHQKSHDFQRRSRRKATNPVHLRCAFDRPRSERQSAGSVERNRRFGWLMISWGLFKHSWGNYWKLLGIRIMIVLPLI